MTLHLAEPGDEPDAESVAEQMPARRVGVLVLGMHRSGSSALTRVLSLLGCTLPQTLMPGNSSNPRGHWESDALVQFNDEILALAGTRWDDWLPVNPRLSETLIWPQLVARGRQLLRQEFAEAPLFVMKDPRNCRLAGFWQAVLAAEGIDPAFVLPLRNPLEVAHSLTTRDGIEEYQGLLIWLRHVLAAEAATRGCARAFTDYAALLNQREAMAIRLSDRLGVVWPRVSALSEAEIAQFLAPELRHHVSDPDELGANPAVSRWVQQAYEVLLDWARHGEKSADYPVLDAILHAFDDAGVAFARPMLAGSLAAQRAAQADVRNAALTEDRDRAAQRLAEVDAELAETIGTRDALADERDQLARRLGEIEAALENACAERDARTAERDRHLSERMALADERDRLAWYLGEVQADFNRVRDECAARTDERDRLLANHAGIGEERDRLAWHLGEAEARLMSADAQNVQASARIHRLDEELAKAQTANDALGHRLAVTESTLRQREEEIAQLGVELAASSSEVTRYAIASRAAHEGVERLSRKCDELRRALGEANKSKEESSAELVVLTRMLRAYEMTIESWNDPAEDNLATGERASAVLTEVDATQSAWSPEAHSLNKALAEAEQRERDSSAELVVLTRKLQNYEQTIECERDRVEWLRSVWLSMTRLPWWWHFLPPRVRRTRELDRLCRQGLFNANEYLARYPDVENTKLDPLRHFVRHGMVEGRKF